MIRLVLASVRSVIARLKGEVWEAIPGRVVVGAGGVGYLVQLPLSTYDQLNPLEGDLIDLRIYQHVRENSLTLYGFARDEEKDVFMLLIDRVSDMRFLHGSFYTVCMSETLLYVLYLSHLYVICM